MKIWATNHFKNVADINENVVYVDTKVICTKYKKIKIKITLPFDIGTLISYT